jgi:hypothetical protein
VQTLFNVTVVDVVVAASLLIVKLLTVGTMENVMLSLDAVDSPVAFFTLK